MGEVTGVDKEQKCVYATNADRSNVPLPYDYLILATGATHSYFGHDEFGVRVQSDLTVPGFPEIFVIGDTASFEEKGKPLPGVAQVAIQQGRYAAKVIDHRITNESPPGPFSYFDGSMAVVGKGFAGSGIRSTGDCVVRAIRWSPGRGKSYPYPPALTRYRLEKRASAGRAPTRTRP
jgi:NADH dehydrogenase FAD-containing subunit